MLQLLMVYQPPIVCCRTLHWKKISVLPDFTDNLNKPLASVVVPRLELFSRTETPGMGLPLSSATLPVISIDWELAVCSKNSIPTKQLSSFLMFCVLKNKYVYQDSLPLKRAKEEI